MAPKVELLQFGEMYKNDPRAVMRTPYQEEEDFTSRTMDGPQRGPMARAPDWKKAVANLEPAVMGPKMGVFQNVPLDAKKAENLRKMKNFTDANVWPLKNPNPPPTGPLPPIPQPKSRGKAPNYATLSQIGAQSGHHARGPVNSTHGKLAPPPQAFPPRSSSLARPNSQYPAISGAIPPARSKPVQKVKSKARPVTRLESKATGHNFSSMGADVRSNIEAGNPHPTRKGVPNPHGHGKSAIGKPLGAPHQEMVSTADRAFEQPRKAPKPGIQPSRKAGPAYYRPAPTGGSHQVKSSKPAKPVKHRKVKPLKPTKRRGKGKGGACVVM